MQYVQEIKESPEIMPFIDTVLDEAPQFPNQRGMTIKSLTDDKRQLIHTFLAQHPSFTHEESMQLAQQLDVEHYKVYKWLWGQKKKADMNLLKAQQAVVKK